MRVRLNVQSIKDNRILHGGDYNPDQWLDQPEVIKQDFKAFKAAKLNTVTLGIFAWDKLEPAEGSMILAG